MTRLKGYQYVQVKERHVYREITFESSQGNWGQSHRIGQGDINLGQIIPTPRRQIGSTDLTRSELETSLGNYKANKILSHAPSGTEHIYLLPR